MDKALQTEQENSDSSCQMYSLKSSPLTQRSISCPAEEIVDAKCEIVKVPSDPDLSRGSSIVFAAMLDDVSSEDDIADISLNNLSVHRSVCATIDEDSEFQHNIKSLATSNQQTGTMADNILVDFNNTSEVEVMKASEQRKDLPSAMLDASHEGPGTFYEFKVNKTYSENMDDEILVSNKDESLTDVSKPSTEENDESEPNEVSLNERDDAVKEIHSRNNVDVSVDDDCAGVPDNVVVSCEGDSEIDNSLNLENLAALMTGVGIEVHRSDAVQTADDKLQGSYFYINSLPNTNDFWRPMHKSTVMSCI